MKKGFYLKAGRNLLVFWVFGDFTIDHVAFWDSRCSPSTGNIFFLIISPKSGPSNWLTSIEKAILGILSPKKRRVLWAQWFAQSFEIFKNFFCATNTSVSYFKNFGDFVKIQNFKIFLWGKGIFKIREKVIKDPFTPW